jgi:hypothetical protein
MLRLGVPVEIPPEDGSTKKRIGRPPTVGHFHDDISPTHFYKILMAPGVGVLPLPDGFRPYISRPGAGEDDRQDHHWMPLGDE